MKNAKKAVLLSLCAIMLVFASVMGTLAYLTSTSEANNTFTVGNVAIKLDEAKVDKDGKAITPEERVNANEYHLLPGLQYDKDPTVTVLANSERCYVRNIVTVTFTKDITELKDTNLDSIFIGQGELWDCVNKEFVKDGEAIKGIKYEYRYEEDVDKANTDTKLQPLFTDIQVPGTLTNAQLALLEGMKINVVAQAIQADSFADAGAAWQAWN